MTDLKQGDDLLAHPRFFSHEQEDSRKVVDPEGRVSEPLECGHDWMLWDPSWVSRIEVELGFGTHSPDRLKVAALKLLHPAPLCLGLWENGFSEIGFILARPGWIPEEDPSAQPL